MSNVEKDLLATFSEDEIRAVREENAKPYERGGAVRKGKLPRRKRRARKIPAVVRLGAAGAVFAGLVTVFDLPGMLMGSDLPGMLMGSDPEFKAVRAEQPAPAATQIDIGTPAATDLATEIAMSEMAPGGPNTIEVTGETVLASTSDVWSGVFRQMGVSYQPPRLAPLEDKRFGACAAAAGDMAYCQADGAIYADFEPQADPAVALGIAHEVGHHIQAMLGTLEGEPDLAQDLQADCFAGVWARNAGAAAAGLSPQALSADPTLADGGRIAAFAFGYEGGSALVCQDMLSGL